MTMLEKPKWKTKGTPKGDDYMMICQNSDPSNSKYPQAAPLGGCNEWVKIGSETTATLCSKCMQRLMEKSFTYKESSDE